MSRILVLATYPIKNPQHGGQKRTAAIVDIYKQNFSSVKFASIFFKGFYKNYSKSDIPVGRNTQEIIRSSPLTGDIACGNAVYEDMRVRRRLTSLLRSYNPTVIHIEQPYIYLGLKRLLKELGISPKLVFGSQNIEAPMKEEMLLKMGIPDQVVQKVTKIIEDVETDLSESCDLLVACTKNDLSLHQKMGAKNSVLAPNGVAWPKPQKKERVFWVNLFREQGVKQIVLFVGSAHPPNWNGFLDVIGKGLGFLPRDTRLVLAGSICDYFDSSINEESLNIEDATFWLRAFSAGRLSESKLIGLLEASELIVLPITEGGGSNLKTAEAIIMDKKVVATSHALRSYEWFRDFPNVWVADTKDDFRDAISHALSSDFKKRNDSQKSQAQKVLWGNCLQELVDGVKKL